jgi:hypothetical protein
VNKLYLTTFALVPLLGCTGTVSDNSGGFGGDGSALEGGGANGTGQPSGASGSVNAGATAGSSNPGSGGVSAIAGATSAGGSADGGTCAVEALPAAVQAMLTNKCSTCHGAVPLAGLPSLVSYANLTAPSKTDPSKTNAVVALARIQAATLPMPPAPGAPVSVSDVSALQAFVSQGYPKPSCPTGTGGAGGGANGGTGGTAGSTALDPLFAMPTCTSMSNWTGGNRGSASMNPGVACISCHKSGDGPSFSIAGTVYPTGHEPDRCNSMVGTAGARIVIIGADGKMLTLTPNAAGNFSSNVAVKTPYQAKVTYQGSERLMLTPQSSGDCNSCHTQNGSMMAPGRITVP